MPLFILNICPALSDLQSESHLYEHLQCDQYNKTHSAVLSESYKSKIQKSQNTNLIHPTGLLETGACERANALGEMHVRTIRKQSGKKGRYR